MMTRWDSKLTKEKVINYYKSRPGLTSYEIAEALNCHSAYIRATLSRAGYKLAHASKKEGLSRSGLVAGVEQTETPIIIMKHPPKTSRRKLPDAIPHPKVKVKNKKRKAGLTRRK